MTVTEPTLYIILWLQAAAPAIRDDAVHYAREAFEGGPDADGALADLEALVGYQWNRKPHEKVDPHTRRLCTDLTDEEIETADWRTVARALVAASEPQDPNPL